MIGAALVFGLIVGGLLGLVGGGGSILAVPALVYGVGMPLSAAIPSSLVVVGASSTMAVLPRIRRDVDWRLALVIGVTGGATAFAGTAVNSLMDQQVLLIVFAAIMVLAGIRMLLPVGSRAGHDYAADGTIIWRRRLPKAVATGIVVGFLTGLLGVGGGFLIVPALALVLGLPMTTAVGTSLVIVVVNSLGGFISHIGNLDLDWALTGAFAGTAMVASYIAGHIGRSLPERVLKRGFASLVFVVAAYVVARVVLAF
ncbi:sulfite exporter TauE/SafE family protein [Arthrobacter sp. AOP36-A1-22]|uniref:sulfite exporter TauE/SafE family protein n=1 Tax=Arthrobacter sp. AOP36-A1-22 TaxID=3457684 RepID=UPI002654A1E3|nr:sulfite exporter TauE/SafE family protein [Micrococcaceae bacterium]MDN5886327.1 sulfite exporter TauE/SafE family protein [Micrococcaceae bacterium]